MSEEVISFWEAIKPILKEPVVIVILAILVLVLLYFLFIKKDKRLKAVITEIVQDMIKDAYNKGVRVEFVVDDIIAKAVAKVKAKPDKYDSLLLWILNAKWFRNKLISIIKKRIEDIAQLEPGTEVKEVEDQTGKAE